mmetsp:Transcript_24031/g.33750  ORF Transcript_24031/g.33750 Transcript_24031/m.33750 type:complete len:410 (+) Transcript_24031:110-1339(+)
MNYQFNDTSYPLSVSEPYPHYDALTLARYSTEFYENCFIACVTCLGIGMVAFSRAAIRYHSLHKRQTTTSRSTNENHDYHGKSSSIIRIILPAILLSLIQRYLNALPLAVFFVSFLGITCNPTRSKDSRQEVQSAFLASMLYSLVFFLSSTLIFSEYCYKMKAYSHYTYYGPARIVNFTTTRPVTNSNIVGRDDNVMHYSGTMTVVWGYEWACPHAPETECISEIHDSQCDSTDLLACRELDDDDDVLVGLNNSSKKDRYYQDLLSCQKATVSCLADAYPHTYEWLQNNASSSLSSSSSVNTSSTPFLNLQFIYGNCNTCTVKPPSLWEESRKATGGGILVVMAIGLMFLFVCNILFTLCWCYKMRTDTENEEILDEEEHIELNVAVSRGQSSANVAITDQSGLFPIIR